MGYHTSNAAYAYDMQPQPVPVIHKPAAPAREERPRFDVVTGAGKAASQDVSPLFTHVIKVAVTLVLVAAALCFGRIALASVTAASLNANGELMSTLSTAKSEASSLEVMHSVYDSDSRIRELALSYGMAEPEGSTTVDITSAQAE